MTTPDQLAATAAFLWGIERKTIFSRVQTQRVVVARQALAWTLRQRGWGQADIGAYLGRDHTTIGYAIEIAERLRERSADFAARLAVLAEGSALPPVDWTERITALERKVAQLETLLTERN